MGIYGQSNSLLHDHMGPSPPTSPPPPSLYGPKTSSHMRTSWAQKYTPNHRVSLTHTHKHTLKHTHKHTHSYADTHTLVCRHTRTYTQLLWPVNVLGETWLPDCLCCVSLTRLFIGVLPRPTLGCLDRGGTKSSPVREHQLSSSAQNALL